MTSTPPSSIDEYIAAAPAMARPILREIRRVIRVVVPTAEEIISYRMPAFRRHGILVYFAAFKNHIGLFPPVSGDAALEKAIAPYAGPKGNLKFPLDEPIPYGLIRRIVRLRVRQDTARAAASRVRPRRATNKRTVTTKKR
ncbi:MAG: iron chaperone [Vicinamibacterales bacterium]